MKFLFIGDLVGSQGRKLVIKHLHKLQATHKIDVTIANVDNAAHGKGVTRKILTSLTELGVDVFTGGNHLFDRREIYDDLADFPQLLRGANYPGDVPGKPYYIGEFGSQQYIVTHLIGQTFMGSFENPFHCIDKLLRERAAKIPIRILDIHAEATSEKIALGRHLDGRMSAVIGTHTHVQTADERILPSGTAFMADVGMTGPHDGIIGMSTDSVLPRFLNGLPTRFEPSSGDPQLHAAVIDVDNKSGAALSIERISIKGKE
jgi:metallophosphoesterase (TIGR00282 family)